MASPLQILNSLQSGVLPQPNPSPAPTPVVVQNNPLGCYSGCAMPPTPASVSLQPNLGDKCGDLQICIKNTSTSTQLVLVLGGAGNGPASFINDGNPASVFSAFSQVTQGLTPVNASPAAVSCNNGIVSGQGNNATYVQMMNEQFSNTGVVVQGWVVAKVRKVNADGPDNTVTQLGDGITAWESDPFDGSVLDICTRTMDVNFCSPCVNGDNNNAPVTFQEDCVTYLGENNGISYVIEPNTQLTLQACYVGIADINQYRQCSLPTFATNGQF